MHSRILACALLSLGTLGACDDAPVTAPESQAPPTPVVGQGEPSALQGLTDRELLITLIARMDALEARLDQEARLAHALVDTIRNAPQWGALAALAGLAGVPPENPGGANLSAGIEALLARTDTLLARSDSTMAALYTPGAQTSLCFDFAIPLTAGVEWQGGAQAEVEGGLGVHIYGNGGKVKVKTGQEIDIKVGIAVEPAFGRSG